MSNFNKWTPNVNMDSKATTPLRREGSHGGVAKRVLSSPDVSIHATMSAGCRMDQLSQSNFRLDPATISSKARHRLDSNKPHNPNLPNLSPIPSPSSIQKSPSHGHKRLARHRSITKMAYRIALAPLHHVAYGAGLMLMACAIVMSWHARFHESLSSEGSSRQLGGMITARSVSKTPALVVGQSLGLDNHTQASARSQRETSSDVETRLEAAALICKRRLASCSPLLLKCARGSKENMTSSKEQEGEFDSCRGRRLKHCSSLLKSCREVSRTLKSLWLNPLEKQKGRKTKDPFIQRFADANTEDSLNALISEGSNEGSQEAAPGKASTAGQSQGSEEGNTHPVESGKLDRKSKNPTTGEGIKGETGETAETGATKQDSTKEDHPTNCTSFNKIWCKTCLCPALLEGEGGRATELGGESEGECWPRYPLPLTEVQAAAQKKKRKAHTPYIPRAYPGEVLLSRAVLDAWTKQRQLAAVATPAGGDSSAGNSSANTTGPAERAVQGEGEGASALQGPGGETLLKLMQKSKTRSPMKAAGVFATRDTVRDRVYQSCAVVGDSSMLLAIPQGESIDRHEAVFRIGGTTPTLTWQKFVGSKTTVRVVRPGNQGGVREGSREIVLVLSETDSDITAFVQFRQFNTSKKSTRHFSLSPAFVAYSRHQGEVSLTRTIPRREPRPKKVYPAQVLSSSAGAGPDATVAVAPSATVAAASPAASTVASGAAGAAKAVAMSGVVQAQGDKTEKGEGGGEEEEDVITEADVSGKVQAEKDKKDAMEELLDLDENPEGEEGQAVGGRTGGKVSSGAGASEAEELELVTEGSLLDEDKTLGGEDKKVDAELQKLLTLEQEPKLIRPPSTDKLQGKEETSEKELGTREGAGEVKVAKEGGEEEEEERVGGVELVVEEEPRLVRPPALEGSRKDLKVDYKMGVEDSSKLKEEKNVMEASPEGSKKEKGLLLNEMQLELDSGIEGEQREGGGGGGVSLVEGNSTSAEGEEEDTGGLEVKQDSASSSSQDNEQVEGGEGESVDIDGDVEEGEIRALQEAMGLSRGEKNAEQGERQDIEERKEAGEGVEKGSGLEGKGEVQRVVEGGNDTSEGGVKGVQGGEERSVGEKELEGMMGMRRLLQVGNVEDSDSKQAVKPRGRVLRQKGAGRRRVVVLPEEEEEEEGDVEVVRVIEGSGGGRRGRRSRGRVSTGRVASRRVRVRNRGKRRQVVLEQVEVEPEEQYYEGEDDVSTVILRPRARGRVRRGGVRVSRLSDYEDDTGRVVRRRGGGSRQRKGYSSRSRRKGVVVEDYGEEVEEGVVKRKGRGRGRGGKVGRAKREGEGENVFDPDLEAEKESEGDVVPVNAIAGPQELKKAEMDRKRQEEELQRKMAKGQGKKEGKKAKKGAVSGEGKSLPGKAASVGALTQESQRRSPEKTGAQDPTSATANAVENEKPQLSTADEPESVSRRQQQEHTGELKAQEAGKALEDTSSSSAAEEKKPASSASQSTSSSAEHPEPVSEGEKGGKGVVSGQTEPVSQDAQVVKEAASTEGSTGQEEEGEGEERGRDRDLGEAGGEVEGEEEEGVGTEGDESGWERGRSEGSGGQEEEGSGEYSVSEGWVTLLLALNSCKKVSVYGWPNMGALRIGRSKEGKMELPATYSSRCSVLTSAKRNGVLSMKRDSIRLRRLIEAGVVEIGMPCSLECLLGEGGCSDCMTREIRITQLAEGLNQWRQLPIDDGHCATSAVSEPLLPAWMETGIPNDFRR